MKKFEHRLIQTDAFGEERINMLTRMGEKGWELVSYTTPLESPKSLGYWFVDMVFKREKVEEIDLRTEAMKWWNNLVKPDQMYFKDKLFAYRPPNSLTGREIQVIYEYVMKL